MSPPATIVTPANTPSHVPQITNFTVFDSFSFWLAWEAPAENVDQYQVVLDAGTNMERVMGVGTAENYVRTCCIATFHSNDNYIPGGSRSFALHWIRRANSCLFTRRSKQLRHWKSHSNSNVARCSRKNGAPGYDVIWPSKRSIEVGCTEATEWRSVAVQVLF